VSKCRFVKKDIISNLYKDAKRLNGQTLTKSVRLVLKFQSRNGRMTIFFN